MKFIRIIFYFFFLIYLLIPDWTKNIGIGEPGQRILLFDFFILLLFILTIYSLFSSIIHLFKLSSLIGIFLFSITLIISILRGLPEYGGFAIGESRWYLCSILLPIGFSIYDDEAIHSIIKIFYIAAIFQSILIIYCYVFNVPWNVEGDAIRFGSGAQSLIISIACVFIFMEIFILNHEFKTKKILMLFVFLLAILFAQTRTIFILLPLMIFSILMFLGKLKLRKFIKFGLISFFAIFILFFSLKLFVRSNVINSIYESAYVIGEIFEPSTYIIITNPNLINYYNADFSESGNTLWRAYAWGQTFEKINNTRLGWIIGLPMGSGFTFFGPNGQLFENLDPHNDYISIISKIGLFGLLGFLLIVRSYFKNFYSIKEKIIQNKERLEGGIVLTVIILSLLLFSLVNDVIRSYGIFFWVWLFLGFGFRMIYNIIYDINPSIEY